MIIDMKNMYVSPSLRVINLDVEEMIAASNRIDINSQAGTVDGSQVWTEEKTIWNTEDYWSE